MSSIEHLLPAKGSVLFDEEELTRELLVFEVIKFLRSNYFDICAVRSLRAMSRDLRGLPLDDLVRLFDDREYHRIQRLHCIPWQDLSAPSRRGAIAMALDFCGLTDLGGPEVMGQRRWAAVLEAVEACVELRVPCVASAASGLITVAAAIRGPVKHVAAPDEWCRNVLTEALLEVLKGPRFNVCVFNRCLETLNAYRKLYGQPEVDAGRTVQRATLDVLHMKDFADMDAKTLSGLPKAIIAALGLDDGPAEALIGADGWARVQLAYANPGFVPQAIEVIDQAVNTVQLEPERPWWRRVWGSRSP